MLKILEKIVDNPIVGFILDNYARLVVLGFTIYFACHQQFVNTVLCIVLNTVYGIEENLKRVSEQLEKLNSK